MDGPSNIMDEKNVSRTTVKKSRARERAAFRKAAAVEDENSIYITRRRIGENIFLCDREHLIFESQNLTIFKDSFGDLVFKIGGSMPASATIGAKAARRLETFLEFLDFVN